jgi:hypothetical protein
MSFVSIVIPTFNRAQLLASTLESIVDQVMETDEIIVVDDGSTDETEKIVSNFGKVRFEKQERQGPGAARNLGWALARGDYVAFLDSDDVWFPWTLHIYRSCVSTFHSPMFLAGSGLWFRNDSELTNVGPAPVQANQYHDYLSSARIPIWLGASCMLVRRDCQARFERYRMNGEDLDFALHLGEEPGFVWIREPFTFGYRRHGATAVTDFDRTLDGMRHLIAEERRAHFPGGHTRREQRWELITRAVRPVALEALKRLQPSCAIELYAATFLWHVILQRWKFLLGFPSIALASLPSFLGERVKSLNYQSVRKQSHTKNDTNNSAVQLLRNSTELPEPSRPPIRH